MYALLPPLLVTSGPCSGTQTPPCCSFSQIPSSGMSCKNKTKYDSDAIQFDRNESCFECVHNSKKGTFLLWTRRRMQKLGASKITQVDFQPKELVLYSKETQTPHTAHLSEGEHLCVHDVKQTFSFWQTSKTSFRFKQTCLGGEGGGGAI